MNAYTLSIILLCSLIALPTQAAPITVTIGHSDPSFVEAQTPEDLEHGRLRLPAFPARPHVEMHMFARALTLGGLDFRLEMPFMTNYSRGVVEMLKGNVTTVGQSVWSNDVSPDRAYISEPMLKDGDMVKVLYTAGNNEKALAARTREDVAALCATTCPRWRRDVEMLKAMGISCVEPTTQFRAMIRMVANSKVDILLLSPTSAEDMRYSWQDNLIPIPGVKAVVHGTRHFVIGKSASNAERIFQALEKGLVIMRENGEIRANYQKAGLFNPKLDTWTQLN